MGFICSENVTANRVSLTEAFTPAITIVAGVIEYPRTALVQVSRDLLSSTTGNSDSLWDGVRDIIAAADSDEVSPPTIKLKIDSLCRQSKIGYLLILGCVSAYMLMM